MEERLLSDRGRRGGGSKKLYGFQWNYKNKGKIK